MRTLFVALRDDLDHSGMIDVVVAPDDEGEGRGVVLTLDKRFADQTALELIHTSTFTVVGKVTQIWPTEDDVVLLYRRSVLSLLPALSQQLAVGVFAFLISMARAIGVVDIEKQMNQALGRDDEPVTNDAQSENSSAAEDELPSTGTENDEDDDDDVRIGNDIAALNPALTEPAIQILPLALCA